MSETAYSSRAELLFRREFAPRAPLYGVFDSAREPAARFEAQAVGIQHESLFAGSMGDLLEDVAPYVSEFPLRSPFREWWFGQWGKSIGVLVEAAVDLSELRRHFRTLMMVIDQERKRYFFRFYDPRVLTVFLPACTPEELKHFFGPIGTFYCEDCSGQELVAFSLGSDGLLKCRRAGLAA